MSTPSHRPRKRFGQNFLQDRGIIDAIVSAINPLPGDNLIEIGPGLGALTLPLLAHCQHLTIIELDRDLAARLVEQQRTGQLPDPERLRIINADALKTDFHTLAKSNNDPDAETAQRLRVVGNLPYNISTPLLFHLLKFNHDIADMHFMLQREVVDRIVAEPGSKQYGRLTVMIQACCEAEPLLDVPPEAFNPAPKVQSAVVRLAPRTQTHELAGSEVLERVTREAFSKRRKTLRNSLAPLLTSAEMEIASVDPRARADALTLDDYLRLAQIVSNRERS